MRRKNGVDDRSRSARRLIGVGYASLWFVRRPRLAWSLVWALGCGAQGLTDSAEETSSGTSSSTSGNEASTTGWPPSATGEASDDAEEPGGSGFIDTRDGGGSSCLFQPDVEALTLCDIWWPDSCWEGSKCMPTSCGDLNTWGSTRCTTVVRNPDPIGAPCTVEQSGTSGIDTCDHGAMCWNVDPQTLEGRCVSFCHGTKQDPMCQAGHSCAIFNEGLIGLCLPSCDPLESDCDEGLACQPSSSGWSHAFVCRPTQASGQVHDECYTQGGCPAGQVCATPPIVDCHAGGCCTSFCDLSDPDAETTCSADDAGRCISWFDAGMAPAPLVNVGVCAVEG